MLLGTPVVATQWSGPADYLTPETGFPIRSTLRPVLDGEYPFASGDWVDPDWLEAAKILQSIYGDAQKARVRAEAALNIAKEKYSSKTVAQKIVERLSFLEATEKQAYM
jgi:glycosyltransferase involved in cell wall biosynthesis